MTTLPSFVELMATLGLDAESKSSASSSHSRSSSASSSRPGPKNSSRHHSRSSSASSLHDADRHAGGRHRAARFSPYSQIMSSERRGSLPSLKCDRENEQPLRPYSTSPRPPSSPKAIARSAIAHLENENPSVSVTDLTANTPISTYVRRRTPQSSPSSPTFLDHTKSSDSPLEDSPMPFSLPTMPYLFPPTSSCYSFPPTSNTEFDRPSSRNSPLYSSQALPDISEVEPLRSRSYRQTGVRVSTSRSELRLHAYRPRISPVA